MHHPDDPAGFNRLDPDDLPHYSRSDLAIAAILDEVDELIGTVDFDSPEPTALTYADFLAESPTITGKPALTGTADHRELANEARSICTELTEATAGRLDPGRAVHAARRMQVVAAQVEAIAEHIDATDPAAMRDLTLAECRARQSARGWRVMAVYAACGGAAVAHFTPTLIGVFA